jgi:hypothetical protein
LPTFFVPGAPQYGLPFVAFLLFTIAYSVLIAWVYVHTGGSVLVATLFHGAINLSQGFFLGGVDPAREYWLLAAVYGAAALVVALTFGSRLSRKASGGSGRSEDHRFCGLPEPAERQRRGQPT